MLQTKQYDAQNHIFSREKIAILMKITMEITMENVEYISNEFKIIICQV